MSLKSARKNINVLNLILIAGIAVIYFYAIAPMADGKSGVKIPAAKQMPLPSPVKAEDPQFPSMADFMIIGEKNLFHPERIIPPETRIAQAEQRPELVLHGTLVTDDFRVAYIEEKRAIQPMIQTHAQPGRDKKQRPIKQGEYIGGYAVKTIDAESITLVKGDDKIVVSIKDGKSSGRARAQESTSMAGRPAPLTGRTYRASNRNSIPPPPSFDSSHLEPLGLELKRPVR